MSTKEKSNPLFPLMHSDKYPQHISKNTESKIRWCTSNLKKNLVQDENGVEICMCNNCDKYFIDHNPKSGAKKYKSSIVSGELILLQPTSKDDDFGTPATESSENLFWGCPNCLTDGYLTDI